MQQNSRCRVCSNREETISHIISECSKLARKEYNTRHDGVDEVIHWESYKKSKFDHTIKWYMHNPASVLENETEIPMGFWHTNGSPNLGQMTTLYKNQQIKKELTELWDFAVPAEHRVKLKESEKNDKYFDLAWELKNCGTWKWRLYQ